MLITVESEFQRHKKLRFRTENYLVGCLSSCIVDTCIVSQSEFRCQGRPISSSGVQKVPPIAGNMFILGLLLVQGECAARGRDVTPNSFVQFTNSVLIKAVPRSSTKD